MAEITTSQCQSKCNEAFQMELSDCVAAIGKDVSHPNVQFVNGKKNKISFSYQHLPSELSMFTTSIK